MKPFLLFVVGALLVTCGGSEFTRDAEPDAGGTAGSRTSPSGRSATSPGGETGLERAEGGLGTSSGGSASGTNGEGGTSISTGGSAGSSGTVVMSEACATVWDTYAAAFTKARTCDPKEDDPQCDVNWILPDRCGCMWPVNGSGDNYGPAQEAVARVRRASCPYITCSAPCETGTSPSCQALGSTFTCQW
jgi:hypothetical protein